MAKEAEPGTIKHAVHELVATPEFANADRINLNRLLWRLHAEYGMTPNVNGVRKILRNRGLEPHTDPDIRRELRRVLDLERAATPHEAREAHARLQERGIETT